MRDRMQRPSQKEKLRRLMTESDVNRVYVLDQYHDSIKSQFAIKKEKE